MQDSIRQARREVQRAFEAVLACADSDRKETLWQFEQRLWGEMLVLGRALVVLFLQRQVSRSRPREYRHGGQRFRIDGERSTELGTRFGKVVFRRPVGRSLRAARAACDLPVDREIGLCAGFSLGVVVGMTRLCAQMAFAQARATFRDIYEWTPSPRAVLRMVDAVGQQAREFLQQCPPPDDDGEVLMIQVDGKGAPMISPTEHQRRCRPHAVSSAKTTRRHQRRQRRLGRVRPRRTKGQKSKNAKVAVVGVLYSLRRSPGGMEGPINKRIYATFQSHEALFVWLRQEADKRGYPRRQTVFLADGSEHIWRLQQKYFPDAETCVDWFHVVEKLWSAGECLYAEGSQELRAWVGRQVERLRRGTTQAVLRELREQLAGIALTGPGNKGRRERLRQTIAYYETHQMRMRYADLRRRDLDIGTGAVEGAVRNLVGMRLDGPGMRWSRQRSERVLHLRCILLNGQWRDFAQHLATRPDFTLAARPEPTLPHDAKAA
jgi:hypothetical protein